MNHPSNLWDITDIPEGTILYKLDIGDSTIIIRRGFASMCAYLSVPLDGPVSPENYQDIELSVHDGLTWRAPGNGVMLPKGHYWLGWDYAHAGDFMFMMRGDTQGGQGLYEMLNKGARKWTLLQVKLEAVHAYLELEIELRTLERQAKK